MWFVLLAACSLAELRERQLSHQFQHADLEPHTATFGETTVHWWSGGDGPPLVLLHGFGGNAVFTWAGQLPLARHHRLIVPDMVWFGGSSSTSDRFGLDLQVDMVLALMDAEHADKADVVGVSYGGLTAFDLAVAHPERIDRLVLVDAPGPVFTDADRDEMLKRIGAASPADIVIPTGPDGVRRLIELGFHHPPKTPGFLLKDVYKHLFSDAVDQKKKLIAALDDDRAKVTAAPWSLPMPTLLVWGEYDPLFTVEVGQRLANAIGPNAKFVTLPDTAHAPNVEAPDAFDAVLTDFLDGK